MRGIRKPKGLEPWSPWSMMIHLVLLGDHGLPLVMQAKALLMMDDKFLKVTSIFQFYYGIVDVVSRLWNNQWILDSNQSVD